MKKSDADESLTDAKRETSGREAVGPKDPWAAAKQQGLYVGGFGSHHRGGAIFAFGDGHVKFLDNGIDTQLYRQMGHRADGSVISAQAIE